MVEEAPSLLTNHLRVLTSYLRLEAVGVAVAPQPLFESGMLAVEAAELCNHEFQWPSAELGR